MPPQRLVRRASAPPNLPSTPQRPPRLPQLDQKKIYHQASLKRRIDKAQKRNDQQRLADLLERLARRYEEESTPEAQPWDHTEIEEAAEKAEALRRAHGVVLNQLQDEEGGESSQETSSQ